MKKSMLAKVITTALAIVVVVMLLAGACTQPAPTPTPSPKPAPASTPAASPAPTPKPSATPTPTQAPASTVPQIPEYKFGFATSPTGATGHVTGSILANFIADKTKGRIRISVIPTAGAIDALTRFRGGEVQVGNVLAYNSMYEVLRAIGEFKGKPPFQMFPILPGSKAVFQTVMRADAPIEKWSDLAGKTIGGGNPGSNGALQTARWLEIAGVQDKVEVVFLAFSAAINSLRDNKIDMSLMFTAAPNANVTEFQTRNPIKFLDFTQSMADEFAKKYFEGNRLVALSRLQKGTYPNMARDANLATIMQPVSVSEDFPEDAAYWITRVVWENLPELHALHPALADTNTEALKEMPSGLLPLHPGALKYFKEKGLR